MKGGSGSQGGVTGHDYCGIMREFHPTGVGPGAAMGESRLDAAARCGQVRVDLKV